ncbi:hypothetical protein [Streptomyces sp. NBC_00199]|uniref:hypothetical protein n=1 Tax=Streptomyces sp. NBC_00199 TaxID=2975678 RepID=UPI002256C631|nr:hypothetical protein [Streptomyces sp. NBC_00199]MCX5265924.1 hypothetical protein [Streptomyces sp. NBC_00199]
MLTLVGGRADGSKKAIQDIHNAEDKQHAHAAIRTWPSPAFDLLLAAGAVACALS